jgi:4'-phosphopantetheinyl transferase
MEIAIIAAVRRSRQSHLRAAACRLSAMDSTADGPAAQVTVWRIDVATYEPDLPALRALLSDDERARAARFLRREDAVRSIVARAGLRILLGRQTGIAPRDLSFVYGANGKPALAPPAPVLHFNVSHSGDVVLVALSFDCPVGVDVEQMQPLPDAGGMVDYVLTPSERALYAALDAAERDAAFYRAWTCKEALAKATGDGLAFGLDRFEVTLTAHEDPRVLALDSNVADAAAWQLFILDVWPGYAAALAARVNQVTLELRDMPIGPACLDTRPD